MGPAEADPAGFADPTAGIIAVRGQCRAALADLASLATALEPGCSWLTPDRSDALAIAWAAIWRGHRALQAIIGHPRRPKVRIGADDAAAAFAAALVGVELVQEVVAVVRPWPVLRTACNRPDQRIPLPARSYDRLLRGVTGARAIAYLAMARREWARLGLARGRAPAVLVELIDELVPRLDLGRRQLLRTHLRCKARRIGGVLGRQAAYGTWCAVAEGVGRVVGEWATRPEHRPALPPAVIDPLIGLLRPGDVIANRKEHRLTTHVLPGYWPHLALVEDPDGNPALIEAQADGIRRRPLASGLAADRCCILRPRLSPSLIAEALQRAASHLGKDYDFDFDCRNADRLVCSELVWRAFDGLGGWTMPIRMRFGRVTVAPQDLVVEAVHGRGWDIVAACDGQSLLLDGPARTWVAETCGELLPVLG